MKKATKKFKSFEDFLYEDYFKFGKDKEKKKSEFSWGAIYNDDN